MLTQTRPAPTAPETAPEIVFEEGRLTADVWASMPETKPHYELIEGELKRKMPTKQEHAYTAFRLAYYLALWGDAHDWSFQTEGLGVRADNFNGFVPDVIGFAPGTRPIIGTVYAPSAFFVAEILSPATASRDRDAKKSGYARAEVEIYLVVDALAKTIEVYRLNGETYREPEILTANAVWEPAEFAGLQLDLAKLWM